MRGRDEMKISGWGWFAGAIGMFGIASVIPSIWMGVFIWAGVGMMARAIVMGCVWIESQK